MSETPKRYKQMLCQTNGNYKYTCFHPVLERSPMAEKYVVRTRESREFFFLWSHWTTNHPITSMVKWQEMQYTLPLPCFAVALHRLKIRLRFVGHHDPQSEIQKDTILTTKDCQIGQI